MMKKHLLAGAVFGALFAAAVTPALADDAPAGTLVPGAQLAQMPPPPMPLPLPSWTGFYAGVNVGAAWAQPHTNSPLANIPGSPLPAYIPSVVTDINNQSPMNLSLSGVTGGGQLGYNWQFNNIVVGAEGEFDGWDMHRTTSVSMPFTFFPVPAGGVAPTYTNKVSSDWFASVRARLGWTPTPSLLIYATGGVAFADWSYTHQFVEGAFPGSSFGAEFAASSKTLVAPAVGGGFEYMLTPSWGLKADYLYMPFGSINLQPRQVVLFTNTPAPVASASVFSSKATNLNANVIRVGLNYHFGAPPPPPPAPAAMPAPPPAAPQVFIVFFDWDRDTITPEGHQIIAQAADAYKSGAPVQIQVTGYTDRSGSPGYNQRLSERRANNVAKALAALGVPPAEMVVSGRGENDNRVPTADGVREPQNRRVEIIKP